MNIKIIKQHNLKVGRQPSAMLPSAITSALFALADRKVFPVLGGGAIRSLFSGETPNDYDIFFVDQYKSIRNDTLESTMRDLEERFIKQGGKVIFRCPENMLISINLNGAQIQLINRRKAPYQNIKHLFDSFDFHVCQFALHRNNVLLTKEALRSLRKKNLTLHRLTYPSATINRLSKYRDKGFYVGECIKDIVNDLGYMEPVSFERAFPDDSLYVD